MSDDSPPLSAASSPISSLPEHLIHHITSFLPPQSAAQLCLLSTRFLSAWKSTPYLSFENSSVDGDEKTTTRFLNYIQSTIAHRPHGFNLEIFRIKSSLRSDQHDVIDSVIDYAIDSGVLILDLELRYRFYSYYLLPPKILSCSSLTALYLTGFNLDPTQSLDGVLTITHPLLQDLKLCHCDKIHSLKLKSCPRLKSLEIKSCVGLESLYIETETSNLESLDFAGTRVVKIYGVSNCPSMRRISVSNLEPYLLTELVSKLPNLESIRLESVKSGSGTFELRHNNLKNAELNFDSQLFVGVKGHKLESISIRYNESQNSDDLIDLAGCESLRSLKLTRAGITNQWIEKNKLIFDKLELLELESCARLKNLKVHNDLLESLVVIGCDKLEKIELNAINLDKFHYDAGNAPIQLPGFVLCSSSRLLARVSLPNQMLINPARFGLSIQNLKSFGHCKLLHLHVSSVKSLTISRSLRELKISPWYDLQTMVVEVTDKATSVEIVDLVDSLLWLAPSLHVLSLFVFGKKKTLNFKYEEVAINTSCESWWHGEELVKVMNTCCEPWWPIKCWRHSLREVTMENFEDRETRELLLQFFMHNSRMYRDKPIVCFGI